LFNFIQFCYYFRSRDISVAIATGYKLDGPGLIPGKDNIFIFSMASRPVLMLTQPPIQWLAGAISPELKRPEHEAGHSSSSSAEVKNGGASTLLRLILHGIVLN
jgi:hypothetical protein